MPGIQFSPGCKGGCGGGPPPPPPPKNLIVNVTGCRPGYMPGVEVVFRQNGVVLSRQTTVATAPCTTLAITDFTHDVVATVDTPPWRYVSSQTVTIAAWTLQHGAGPFGGTINLFPAPGYQCLCGMDTPVSETLHLTDSAVGASCVLTFGGGATTAWRGSTTGTYPGEPTMPCPSFALPLDYSLTAVNSVIKVTWFIPYDGHLCPQGSPGGRGDGGSLICPPNSLFTVTPPPSFSATGAITASLYGGPQWPLDPTGTSTITITDSDDSPAPASPTLPPLWRQGLNLASAVATHVAAGRPELDDAAVAARLAVCESCPALILPEWRCGDLPGSSGCGCWLKTKSRWADQWCPRGKWPDPA